MSDAKAKEKVLDANNGDDGVLEVRLGAIMKQMMLYLLPYFYKLGKNITNPGT